MTQNLAKLCEEWEEWAVSADRRENGWESDFPRWDELVSAACGAMVDAKGRQEYYTQIEMCWRVSEEDQDMADFAGEHLLECWQLLLRLARSQSPKVRWQVYAIAGLSGPRGEELLRDGLADSDSYCRRRAFLALRDLNPHDFPEVKLRFQNDDDPVIREVAASKER